MNLIFDAGALIALLHDENGAEAVEMLLSDTSNICYVHAINLCEVYYDFLRRADESEVQKAIQKLLSTGLNLNNDLDPSLWQQVGRYKAELRRVSPCGLLLSCSCPSDRRNSSDNGSS
jgi:PIN domain nuclease of toxin-antitoxin system